jgi:hypothetical protein
MKLTPAFTAAAVFALATPSALAATTLPESTSQNWAGYVASSGASFSRVSGSWVQPSADASSGDGYSAFWVGLGGSDQSTSLEQVGTQADVINGQTVYYAWYELVPAAPVKLPVAIHPGDHISASVAVSGSDVTVSLSNQTTGSSTTRALKMNTPDTSTAEWIAEAPSSVDGYGDMQTLPLANFGSVDFTSATATAGGHTGPISDSAWSAQPVQLNGTGAGAQPGGLSSDGATFSVAWQGESASSSYAYGGDGYGSGGYYGPGAYDGGYGPGAYYGYGAYAPPGYAYGY